MAEEYYGYKAPVQPSQVAEESDAPSYNPNAAPPSGTGISSPPPKTRPVRQTRAEKKAEIVAKKKAAQEAIVRRKADAAAARKGGKQLVDSTPDVKTSEEIENPFSDNDFSAPNDRSNYPNDLSSIDSLPDGYGERSLG